MKQGLAETVEYLCGHLRSLAEIAVCAGRDQVLWPVRAALHQRNHVVGMVFAPETLATPVATSLLPFVLGLDVSGGVGSRDLKNTRTTAVSGSPGREWIGATAGHSSRDSTSGVPCVALAFPGPHFITVGATVPVPRRLDCLGMFSAVRGLTSKNLCAIPRIVVSATCQLVTVALRVPLAPLGISAGSALSGEARKLPFVELEELRSVGPLVAATRTGLALSSRVVSSHSLIIAPAVSLG